MPVLRLCLFSAGLVWISGLARMPSNPCQQSASFGRLTSLRLAAVAKR